VIYNKVCAYRFFVICDIKSFFPSIDRALLRAKLDKMLQPGDAAAIMRYACCCGKGIAQGSPLSPALSNCYLYEMDRALANLPHTFYLRYADDLLFLTDAPNPALNLVKEWMERLYMSLSEQKLASGLTKNGFDFVGFSFFPENLLISEKKQREMNERIRCAPEHERKTIFRSYEAYYRNTTYLRPDINTLQWVLQYASLPQAAGYIRRFSDQQWAEVQPVLERMEHTWKALATRTMATAMGRAFA